MNLTLVLDILIVLLLLGYLSYGVRAGLLRSIALADTPVRSASTAESLMAEDYRNFSNRCALACPDPWRQQRGPGSGPVSADRSWRREGTRSKLRVLLDEEVRGRDQATRTMRRKAAGLPSGKSFDSWREQDSSIPIATQSALATLEWVHRAENLAISGPSGTGKTHLVEALASKVIDAGMRVSWFTLESLTATLGRAGVDGSIGKVIARITRAELIVVDLCRYPHKSTTSACCPPDRP